MPAFVDSSSYVTNRHKTSFGAVCRASVLICPYMLYAVAGPLTTAKSSLFPLDVYGESSSYN